LTLSPDTFAQIEVDQRWASRRELQPDGQFSTIRTLEGHRQALREALENAQQDVIIVSPWITRLAIEQDGVLSLLAQAAERGVTCTIFYDKALSEKAQYADEVARNQSREVVAGLQAAGAKVYPLHNVHAKEIFVDERYPLMGSFNWLSVSRQGKWVRHEISTRYEGPLVGKEKETELKVLMSLVVGQ
jgi:phosphatidylserine/phosphatidylglycerophosphate/cardiolipin synthase-like enzyme